MKMKSLILPLAMLGVGEVIQFAEPAPAAEQLTSNDVQLVSEVVVENDGPAFGKNGNSGKNGRGKGGNGGRGTALEFSDASFCFIIADDYLTEE